MNDINLAELINPDNLPEAFDAAETPELLPLTPAEIFVGKQRKWAVTYPGVAVPENEDELQKIIPANLTEEEKEQYLRGSAGEAKKKYINVLNTSWTKKELNETCIKEGLMHALEIFAPKEQESLKTVPKYLPEE